MTRVDLPLQRLGFSLTSSKYTVSNHEVLDCLIHELRAFVASEKQPPFVYKVPASWWQHFKQAVFPAWLQRKFPVKYTEHSVTVRTLYPFLKSKLPPDLMGPTVTVCMADRSIGCFMSDTDGISPAEWVHDVKEILMKERLADYQQCPVCRRAWFEHPL